MKGAFFYREVARVLGEAAVDEVIAGFYQANVGRAAHMSAMVDALAGRAGERAAVVEDLATKWLRTLDCPVDTDTLCL